MSEENVNPNNIQKGDIVKLINDKDSTEMAVEWVDLNELNPHAKCTWLDANKHQKSGKYALVVLKKGISPLRT